MTAALFVAARPAGLTSTKSATEVAEGLTNFLRILFTEKKRNSFHTEEGKIMVRTMLAKYGC